MFDSRTDLTAWHIVQKTLEKDTLPKCECCGEVGVTIFINGLGFCDADCLEQYYNPVNPSGRWK